jgi:hypothetical protein
LFEVSDGQVDLVGVVGEMIIVDTLKRAKLDEIEKNWCPKPPGTSPSVAGCDEEACK